MLNSIKKNKDKIVTGLLLVYMTCMVSAMVWILIQIAATYFWLSYYEVTVMITAIIFVIIAIAIASASAAFSYIFFKSNWHANED